MSDADLGLFLTYAPLSPARNLRITGGDPLTHPKFRDYITAILELIDKPIELATNGLWLPRYQDMIPLFLKVHITDYGDKNKWVIMRYGHLPQINVISWGRYYSRTDDPHWSPAEARRLGYDRCPLSQANIVGDRVYGCCLSEAITRHNQLDPDLTSIHLGPNWLQEYEAKDMIAACQHCFVAHDTIKNGSVQYG